jgi:hypothetical protein
MGILHESDELRFLDFIERLITGDHPLGQESVESFLIEHALRNQ